MMRSSLFVVVILALSALTCQAIQIADHRPSTNTPRFRQMQAAEMTEINGGGAIHDGDRVPSSAATVIAQSMDSQGDSDATTTTFSEAETQSDRGSDAAQQSSQGGEDYSVHVSKWDPEVLNRNAIHRVAHDIPDLLKQVDAAIPKFTHNALTDYAAGHNHQQRQRHHATAESDSDDNSFLEVEDNRRFATLSMDQRENELMKRKYDLQKLKDTVQLELQATTKLQERAQTHIKSKNVLGTVNKASSDDDLDQLVSNEVLENNPQLKEWADEARFHQNKKEITSLLDEAGNFLDRFKVSLKNDKYF